MSTTQAPKLVVRSCEEECLTECEGQVKGTIPDWLSGTLIRNGVGITRIGSDQYEHAFDGLALLHRFVIRPGGKVTYQNRFLNGNTYRKNVNANRIIVGSFGTVSHPDPCATLFQNWTSSFTSETTDNANVNILRIGDGVYAADETSFIVRIDPDTLQAKERVDLKQLFSVQTCTAHPHYGSDGSLYNIGTNFGTANSSYCIVSFPSKGEESVSRGEVLCRIPFSKSLYPSYYHSFGMSENYFIFVEQCLKISIPSLLWKYVSRGSFESSLKWSPDHLTRFRVVRRSTGALLATSLVSDPFVVFHHANAFESDDGREVIVDLVAYRDGQMVKSLYYKNLISAGHDPQQLQTLNQSQTYRFVLPLTEPTEAQVDAGSNIVTFAGSKATATARQDGTIFCVPENLTPGLRTFEMPQFNYSGFCGKPYTYLYGVAKVDESSPQGLAKVDVNAKSHVEWTSQGFIPGEPVFVPRPGAIDEDDGVLLSALLSENEEKEVSLVALDARSMSELGRATFQCPGSILPDFHGIFCSDTEERRFTNSEG